MFLALRDKAKNAPNLCMDFSAIRKKFAVREDLVWLNNCGVSIGPTSSTDEVKNYLAAFSEAGVLQTLKPHGQIKRNIQSYFAEFFGGKPSEYALLNNTAEGMTFIAQSLRLAAGDTILLVEREYPSNIYPFLQLKKNGINIRYVSPGLSNENFVKNIEAALDSSTRAMSLSAVDWLTGLKFDLYKIGKLLKSRNVFFIVDAAQGAGHVPIDVGAMGIDAMAFSCWKWLLGPLGSGGLFVADDFLPKLDIRVAGTSSVKNDEVYLPHREDYKESVERFMLSTAPYMNWIYLEASLKFLHTLGLSVVQSRLYELADKISEILRGHGFSILRDEFAEHKTAIVSAKRDGDMAALHAHLMASGIICAYREGYIRFSPHLNVVENDLKKLSELTRP